MNRDEVYAALRANPDSTDAFADAMALGRAYIAQDREAVLAICSNAATTDLTAALIGLLVGALGGPGRADRVFVDGLALIRTARSVPP